MKHACAPRRPVGVGHPLCAVGGSFIVLLRAWGMGPPSVQSPYVASPSLIPRHAGHVSPNYGLVGWSDGRTCKL